MCGSCVFGRWFLAVALVEAIDASSGIDQLLFAGEERVASRANFDVQVALLGGAGLERLAASAGNIYFDVFWVNSWFHLVTFSRRHTGRIFKQAMIGARPVTRQAETGLAMMLVNPEKSCKSCLQLLSIFGGVPLPEDAVGVT